MTKNNTKQMMQIEKETHKRLKIYAAEQYLPSLNDAIVKLLDNHQQNQVGSQEHQITTPKGESSREGSAGDDNKEKGGETT